LARTLKPEAYEDEMNGRFLPAPEDWLKPAQFFDLASRAERSSGSYAHEPTWWLLYGNVVDGRPVRVTMVDGQQPDIQTFGPLRLCEWAGGSQSAVVSIAEPSSTVFDRVPDYLARPDSRRTLTRAANARRSA
jgi:hypothetical protein